MSEEKQTAARPVSAMSEAERKAELDQLNALLPSLTGADNKKKRGRVNGRITQLRESLGLAAVAEKSAPVAAKTQAAEKPATANGATKNQKPKEKAARKESGATDKPTRKESGAAAPPARKDSNAQKGGKPRSESKSAEKIDALNPPAGKIVLGYWDIRGLAEPIRYVLEYAKAPYVERLYYCSPGPNYDMSDWFNEKFNPKLGLDIPNLPYLLDGSVRITQSGAIIRHLARKYNLYGSPEDAAVVDMLQEELLDQRKAILGHSYNKTFAEETEVVKQKAWPEFAKKFEGFLGKKKFLLGDKVTFVDFLLYALLDVANIMAGFLSSHPRLATYHANVRNLPGIKEYLASPRFKARPVNNQMAYFK